MAYGRPLDRECYVPGCLKRAAYEVFNQWNASMGEYCRHHADQRVKELSKAEDRARPGNQPEDTR